jgi:hypothetical protein
MSKENLSKRNLILVNLKCKSMQDISANCDAKKSHITYRCRPGFRFETNQDIFKSKCKFNIWEEVPRCLPGKYNQSLNKFII